MATTNKSHVDYTKLSQELDEVMADLTRGDLDIDRAVACYERGLSIISVLEKHVIHAENRVAELREAFDAETGFDSDVDSDAHSGTKEAR